MGTNAAQRTRLPIASWAWAAIGTIACAAMIPLEPSLLEEGLILHFAQRLVDGERLYRDLVFFSGPFPFELLAALFRVFGEEVVVGRAAVAALAGASTGCAFAIARRAGAGAAAHATAACIACAPALLFPLLSTYFYSTLSLHLGIIAAYAAHRGMESARFGFAAGVLIACVALTKQSVGAVLAVGLVAVLFWHAPAERRVRQTGFLIAGGAAVAIITLVWFGLRGDLDSFVQAVVVMPFQLGDSFSSSYVNFWPPGEFDPQTRQNQAFYLPHLYNILSENPAVRSPEVGWPIVALTQFLFAMPVIAVLLPLILRLFAGPLAPGVWFCEAVLIGMIANLFPRADWGHLVFVLPIAFAQVWMTLESPRRQKAAAVIQEGTGGDDRVVAMLASWASWGWVGALGLGAFVAGSELHGMASAATLGPRVPQLPVSRAYQSPGVSRAVRFLRDHTTAGEAIFVARAEPLVYFATGTRNPTPYGGVLPGMGSEQERTILEALRTVRYVVMSEIDQPLFLYYRDQLPAVQSYLERFFQVPKSYRAKTSWILVLERGPDRGPAVIDLFERRFQARAWTRNAAGVESENSAAAPELASRQNRRPLAFELRGGGGGLDFEIDVPANAIFRADIGLNKIDSTSHARRVRLEVLVSDPNAEAGEFQVLWSKPIRSKRQRTWRPVEVDLAGFSGRSVTLRLQAVGNEVSPLGTVAWWGSPQVIARPPEMQ